MLPVNIDMLGGHQPRSLMHYKARYSHAMLVVYIDCHLQIECFSFVPGPIDMNRFSDNVFGYLTDISTRCSSRNVDKKLILLQSIWQDKFHIKSMKL